VSVISSSVFMVVRDSSVAEESSSRAEGAEAVTALLVGLYPQLVAALSLYTDSPAFAEDVAQDALVRAWERREQLAALGDPRLWVFRVAMNRSRSLHRRLRVERKQLRVPNETGRPASGQVEDALIVRAALRKLPPRQRSAVVLRYYGELSVEETAEVMGCASGTVKALTSQAMASLRSRLEGESWKPIVS
jgi:RNA polymerase sigma-70 factor (sigma-E family)